MKSIHVVAETLPGAWEEAVLKCWNEGDEFKTQYDKPEDPKSKDVTALIHCLQPFKEPRIHLSFPGGFNDLEKYRLEVLEGVHDHWIKPEEGKWEYTYSQRLFNYDVLSLENCDVCHKPHTTIKKINQIERCIELLKECGHTRRAQAVTWQAWKDLGISDPSCLQRMWFRVQNNKLNMNIHIRSNDAYKAAFMNMYAFTELQKYVADRVGVEVGEYMHIADSFHIYGSYFHEFSGFLKSVERRSFAQRTADSGNESVTEMLIQGCDELLKEEDMPEDKRVIIQNRRNYLVSTMS